MPPQAYLFGYIVPKMDLNSFLGFTREITSHNDLEILQGVNSDLLAGEKHFLSALWHTRQAFAAARNIAKRPDVELVRFLSCQRQIAIAFKLIGLKDSNEPVNVALMIVGAGISQISAQINQDFMEAFNAQRNDTVLCSSDKKLGNIAQTFWNAEATPVIFEELLEHIALTALDI